MGDIRPFNQCLNTSRFTHAITALNSPQQQKIKLNRVSVIQSAQNACSCHATVPLISLIDKVDSTMNLDGKFSAPLCHKTCLIGDHTVDGYDYANSYVGTDGLKQHYSCNLTHKSFDRPAPALFFSALDRLQTEVG